MMLYVIIPKKLAETIAFDYPDTRGLHEIGRVTMALEENHIRPALGRNFYVRVCKGAYPEFVQEYLKPAIELTARAIMMIRNLPYSPELPALRCEARQALLRVINHVDSAPEGTYPPLDENETRRMNLV